LNFMWHVIVVRSDDINCHAHFQSYLMTKQTKYYYYYYYLLFDRENSISWPKPLKKVESENLIMIQINEQDVNNKEFLLLITQYVFET
jgi:hypothetical protein